eukprot:scaffold204133_cov22-Tisochrysis_lutea.AAC.1
MHACCAATASITTARNLARSFSPRRLARHTPCTHTAGSATNAHFHYAPQLLSALLCGQDTLHQRPMPRHCIQNHLHCAEGSTINFLAWGARTQHVLHSGASTSARHATLDRCICETPSQNAWDRA